jgi:RNA polymerase sigma-70 factor (ECF subfamily)
MRELVDQFLLYRAKSKGDTQAFGRLYDRHIDDIYRFIYLKTGQKETAQDLSSEVFLRLWKQVHTNQIVKNPRGYLYKIARNLLADYYRGEHAKRPESLDAVVTFPDESASHSNEGILSDAGSSKRQIEAGVDASMVLRHISCLKEDFRDVLLLRLVHGLTFDEIALVLEKRAGTTRVIFHRAMKALRSVADTHES